MRSLLSNQNPRMSAPQASQAPEAFGRFDGPVIEERGGMHETCPIVRPGNQQVEDDEGA